MKPWIFVAAIASPLAAQNSLVTVPQVPRSRAAVEATAPVNIDPERARSTKSDGSINTPTAVPLALSREVVLACRGAQLGNPVPQGVNCDEVMRRLAEVAAERSAEGALLSMLGERNTVTRPDSTVRENGLNPDAVARQLSSGNVQGLGSNSDVAAIAARQRLAPQSGAPRQ